MFSLALSVGTRLKDWKTKPISSRRSAVSALSFSPVSSTSPMRTEPESAVSRAAQQCIRVDLPEPLGPMTAVNSPAPMSRVTPSSARLIAERMSLPGHEETTRADQLVPIVSPPNRAIVAPASRRRNDSGETCNGTATRGAPVIRAAGPQARSCSSSASRRSG